MLEEIRLEVLKLVYAAQPGIAADSAIAQAELLADFVIGTTSDIPPGEWPVVPPADQFLMKYISPDDIVSTVDNS